MNMFKMLGSLGNLANVAKIQEEISAELAQQRFEGKAGGGMVTVTINGAMQLLGCTIDPKLIEDKEQELAGKLIQFNEIVHQVAKRATPNTLCTYLFELAGVFSSFYEACPILSTEDEAIKLSRLKLAQLTAKTLKQGLDLLGIETLERM